VRRSLSIGPNSQSILQIRFQTGITPLDELMTCHHDRLMDQRRNQLRRAKQRQRERDREAGLVLYQTKLALYLARRLKAGLNNPGFRELFNKFLETELIELSDFPQLKQLCWNLKIEFLTRADALAMYERNWRLIDQAALEPTERRLIDELVQELGKGMLNA
jgi:hypothetical protein